MRGSRVLRQGGVIAAIAAAAVTAAVGAAGASSGAADTTIYASETNGNCFTTSPAKPDCATTSGDVSIETGDTVTWDFAGSGANHNAASANDVPADPAWKDYATPFSNSDAYSREFTQPGVYEYVCQAHPGMDGTITVTGEPIATQTPSPTPTPTATASPSPQPSAPGTHTPPPTGGAPDLVEPTLGSLGAKGRRRALTVSFTLSENATVLVRVKRGRRVIKSVARQVAAGERRLRVRSAKLRKGRRYTVELRARDASGNRSTPAFKSLRIRR